MVIERLGGRDDEGAAERRQLGQVGALAQQVLDLAGEVERHPRELRVDRPRHRQRVARSVEEIGIAERHVRSAGGYLLANVGEDRLDGHDEEPAAVHRRDGAVQAGVQAAAARLDVPRGNALAIP